MGSCIIYFGTLNHVVPICRVSALSIAVGRWNRGQDVLAVLGLVLVYLA